MDDIKIIDDALPKDLYSFIKAELLRTQFQWSMIQSTATELDNDVSFCNIIYSLDENKRTALFPYLQSAYLGFTSYMDGKKTLLRIRGGLIVPKPKPTIHAPHIDNPNPHWAALLYFNTEEENGHTYFYKERYNPKLYKNPQQQLENSDIEVLTTVSPKENRLVIFKGDIFHSSSSPVDIPYRIVINYNFTVKGE